MKVLFAILTLILLAGTVSAITLPQVVSFPAPPQTGTVPVATFESGQRYQAGDYPVVVLTGSFKQMGRQYGSLMKTELLEEYAFILASIQKRGYTQKELRAMGRETAFLYPKRQQELFKGMAETSGLTFDDILVLYNGGILYLSVQPAPPQPATPASCSYLAVWGNYTTDGSVIASRNWDLPDEFLPFNAWYVLAVYRPSDGSNGVATWGPAGMRPETLMNSKGLFIADDNSGLDDGAADNRPDLVSEFFGLMLDYSDLKGLDAGIRGARTNVAWIVDVAGPDQAFVYELMTNNTRQRSGNGVVAAANHFVDPAWNLPTPPTHSLSRYNNLIRQAAEAKGSIDDTGMMQIRNVRWENGGATFIHSDLFGSKYSTNHQAVFLPASRTLWIKTLDKNWQKVELAPLFGR
jgi:hypothetical protein